MSDHFEQAELLLSHGAERRIDYMGKTHDVMQPERDLAIGHALLALAERVQALHDLLAVREENE